MGFDFAWLNGVLSWGGYIINAKINVVCINLLRSVYGINEDDEGYFRKNFILIL